LVILLCWPSDAGPIDGIQVAIQARQRHPHIPVIVVSAEPGNAQRLNGLAPHKTFISKPYRLDALVATLRRMLKARD